MSLQAVLVVVDLVVMQITQAVLVAQQVAVEAVARRDTLEMAAMEELQEAKEQAVLVAAETIVTGMVAAVLEFLDKAQAVQPGQE